MYEKNAKTNSIPKKKKVIYERELPTDILYELEEEQLYQYQIWDSIFKRLLQVYPKMIFPIIKEIFDEEYADDAKIVFLSMEYTIDRIENSGKRILHSIRADLIFQINDEDIYHLECQIQPELEMVIRMFEYDTQTSIQHAITNDNGESVITFPKSVILYLSHTSRTPDKERLLVHFPDETYMEYAVPVMKVQDYTLSMIHSRYLYALLPLALVRFRKNKKEEYTDEDINELTEFIKGAIFIIEQAVNEGTITECQRNDIIDFMFRAGRYLFRKDVEILWKMDEYVPPFLKFQREIVEDLKVEKEEAIRRLIESENAENKSTEECSMKLQKVFALSEVQAKEKIDMYWSK